MLARNVKLHGARPWPLKMILPLCVARNVKLHGTRPWPLKMLPLSCVATTVKLHGARRLLKKSHEAPIFGTLDQVKTRYTVSLGGFLSSLARPWHLKEKDCDEEPAFQSAVPEPTCGQTSFLEAGAAAVHSAAMV